VNAAHISAAATHAWIRFMISSYGAMPLVEDHKA
jgi:hypothetical protein